MEEIVLRLADLRHDYFKSKGRLGARHPLWSPEGEVRLTVFFKIANVLNCTQHGLTHLTLHMLEEEWWQEHTDSVPSFELRAEQAGEFDTFCKVGCFHGVFSMLESSLRQIVRTLDPSACSNGTAEFKSIYSWLLSRLGLQSHDSLLDLLRCTRSTFHNNGYYFHRSGSYHIVTHRGSTYEFHQGKPVEFVTWGFVLDRLGELRESLEVIVEAPEVAAVSQIGEP